MQGFNIPVATFNAWVAAGDNLSAKSTIFANNDTISGGPLDDLLRAYGGNDSISGGGGSDTLDGGSGDDTLDGGSGSDTIITGGGADVIVVGQGQSGPASGAPDVVTDWSSSDTLRFAHPPVASTEYVEGSAADFASATTFANGLIGSGGANVVAVAVGSDVVVFADSAGDNGSADDVVILSGRSLADVSAANFGVAPPKVAAPPNAPTGLALDAASDSGAKGDGLTNVAQLRVTGVADPGVHVSLYDGTTLVGAGDADPATGAFSFTTASALVDGAHTLTAQATNAAGASAASAALTVTVDTAAPTGLALDTSTDSGAKGDGITNVAQVRIDGLAEKGASVTLFDGATVVGAATADPTTGAFSVQATSALADGAHVLGVQATDAAGNVGSMASASFIIDTHAGVASIGGFTDTPSGARSTVVLTGTATDATA